MAHIQVSRPLPTWEVEFKSADVFTGSTPRQLCRHYVLSVLLAGRGSRRYRGGTYQAADGSCALMQPDEVYSGDAEGMTYRSLWVAPATLESLAADRGRAAMPPRFSEAVLPDKLLAHKIRQTFRLAALRQAQSMELEETLLDALVHLLDQHAEGSSSTPAFGVAPRAVNEVRDYIDENYCNNIRLDELSMLAGLSAYRLSHVFRATVGVPPHEYLTQTRVAHAKSLLSEGVSAGETAQRVGFFDQAHLTRHFRRLVQVTPGSYQRLCRQWPTSSYNRAVAPAWYDEGTKLSGESE